LLPESSWLRLQEKLEAFPQLSPVLFTDKGELIYQGNEQKEKAIQLAWHNFDLPYSKMKPFAEHLLAASSLEFVQTAASGLDSPFFKKLAAKGITLCNSDAQANSIAEYVLATLLGSFQNFAQRAALQRDKKWKAHPFRELAGSHCLVLGYGNIGSRIVDRLLAFKSEVSVIRRQNTAVLGATRTGTLADLPEYLASADIVILASALNSDTHQIFDEAMFSRFKPGATIVNIARGAMIHEQALLQALDDEILDYAILDVFEVEPLPVDNPFWHHEKVLVSAHTSNDGSGRMQRGDDLFLENLEAYLTAQPLRNQVDLSTLD
jgi:phosphoglycerate dehydrogenase-like enzyme